MFPHSFFPKSFFAQTYWEPVEGAPPPPSSGSAPIMIGLNILTPSIGAGTTRP